MKKPKMNTERPEFMNIFANEMPPFMLARTSFLLHKVGIRMIDLFEEALVPLHIKPPHFMVMAVLSMEQPSSQIDIGDKVSFDRNKMVNIVDELEQLGLAKRQMNQEDRRAKAVCLTDAGRAAFEAALKLERAVEDQVLSGLTPPQRKQLQDLLKALATAKAK